MKGAAAAVLAVVLLFVGLTVGSFVPQIHQAYTTETRTVLAQTTLTGSYTLHTTQTFLEHETAAATETLVSTKTMPMTITRTVTETLTETGTTATERTTATEVTEPPKPTGALGTIEIDDFLVVFNYTETTEDYLFYVDGSELYIGRPEENYENFVLVLTIKNLGIRESLCPSYTLDSELEVDKGYIYSGEITLEDYSVRPGERTYGVVYFEIRKDTEPLKLTIYHWLSAEIIFAVEFGRSTTASQTTTTETTTTETTTQQEFKYCGSINSDVYHYPWCTYAKKIKPENLIWFVDEYDAKSQGYRPCKVCNPPG